MKILFFVKVGLQSSKHHKMAPSAFRPWRFDPYTHPIRRWMREYEQKFGSKVEEPVPVRVMIRIVEILLYLIFQSPKPVG
jgi:hypothetical protein